jgi:hypothetical protein
LVEAALARLEFLYVSRGGAGFTHSGGDANAKLEYIGKVARRKRIHIHWWRFPLMESLMVPSLVLERELDPRKAERESASILSFFRKLEGGNKP